MDSSVSPLTSRRNPLMEISYRFPFNEVEVAQIVPTISELIVEAKKNLQAIIDLKEPRTFGNTMLALDRADVRLSFAMNLVSHLEGVATTPDLNSAIRDASSLTGAFSSEVFTNEALFQVVLEYSRTTDAQASWGARKRYVEQILRAFRRNGVDLPTEKKARLLAIDSELARVTNDFGENVRRTTAEYELIITDGANLAGLPESARAAAQDSAQKKGRAGWRFTLQAPSVVPVLEHLDDARIRETIFRAFNARGAPDNGPLAEKILAMRAEKATLLGYQDFADLVTEERMAKNGAAAFKFVAELSERVKPRAEEEFKELGVFRRQLEGPDAPDLNPWDGAYYAEKLRQKRYNFQDEQLRPYFKFENVLGGAFEVAQKIFELKIEQVSDFPVWHPDVTTFKVTTIEGDPIGYFHADFFPREEKRAGAWMNQLISGTITDPTTREQLGFIAGNFSPPVGGKPALLTHDEVTTLFHEFGHLLHQLLTKAELRSQAGTNVAWDFVELPSQIMENWAWNRKTLDLFARHYETGATLPDALYEPLIASRNFRSASFFYRQLGLAIVDLKLHREYQPQRDGEVISYSNAIFQSLSFTQLPEGYAAICNFTHLFSDPVGYGAGYYSYKWAEVLDADAFSRFEYEGLLDPKVGRDFRDKILSKGDTEDPATLFRSFMGRDPDPLALLRRSGIVD